MDLYNPVPPTHLGHPLPPSPENNYDPSPNQCQGHLLSKAFSDGPGKISPSVHPASLELYFCLCCDTAMLYCKQIN